jgi:hypothetical protein
LVGTSGTLQLNEILPNPKTLYSKEWVELANTDAVPIALDGWMLDDGADGGAPYAIEAGTIVGPHGLFVVTLPRALFNNAGDEVRLLRPDGGVADQFSYANSAVDLSFCRSSSGWVASSPPSPNAPNECDPAQAAPATTQLTPELPNQPLTTTTPTSGTDILAPPPTPRRPSWSSEDIVGAMPYALSTGGLLYRGLRNSSPTAQPTAPPTPTRKPRLAPSLQPTQPNTLVLFSRIAGILFLVLSAAIAGYTRLRAYAARNDAALPAPDAEILAMQSDS